MAELINRGLSLAICVFYVVAMYMHVGAGAALKLAAGLLLPLACIWFPEALGQYRGTMRLQAITADTPALLVRIAGWFLLVGLPLILYALFRKAPAT